MIFEKTTKLLALFIIWVTMLFVAANAHSGSQQNIHQNSATVNSAAPPDLLSTSPLTTKDVLTLCAAFIALCVSVGNAWYGWRKDRRLRIQSIEDDFWLRKVLGPLAIEPLIKSILDLIAKIPPDCSSKSFDQKQVFEFGLQSQPQIQLLTNNLSVLSLVSTSLSEKCIDHLDEIEDCLLNYCALNFGKKTNQGLSSYTQDAVKTNIQAHMLKILVEIKKHQTNSV